MTLPYPGSAHISVSKATRRPTTYKLASFASGQFSLQEPTVTEGGIRQTSKALLSKARTARLRNKTTRVEPPRSISIHLALNEPRPTKLLASQYRQSRIQCLQLRISHPGWTIYNLRLPCLQRPESRSRQQ